jgi:fucose 4-O-acetylase-like acetyltransferase
VPAAEGEDGAAPGVVAISMLCAIAGVIAIIAVSRLLADVPFLSRGLAYAGRRTMHLFLIHLLFTAGTRIVLVRAGVTDLATHIVLGTAAGIAGPLLAGVVIDRLGVKGLMALPPSIRARIRRSTAAAPAPARRSPAPELQVR